MHPLLRHLPDHLAERSRTFGAELPAAGAFVVYWMRLAARGHDNPALDAALTLADALGRPLVVWHTLGDDDRFASDRLHRFALEGARDVAVELAGQGIAYVLQADPGAPTAAMLRHASVLVCEDLPTPAMRRGTSAAVERGEAPVLAVDAACILPMRLVKKRPDRAFRFRQQTQAARLRRLELPWPIHQGRVLSELPASLPFAPVGIANADIEALVAEADIDHGIGPVADSEGGSRAGYARWGAFRDFGLRAYARRRNDALDRDGVSRMSAYLHFGHVSPFVLAREALATGGPGADKFLDELLIWRELAHAWCHHTAEIEHLDALPGWARMTLDAHSGDPRPASFDAETLARGRTGDALWDAAQRSLVQFGELHNNLRMTWGKALVPWSATPDVALQHLVDLNHRYALDGRDPSSYGGLLWCLGLFDRPFEPPSPVTGTLRARPTAAHAKRLDVAAFEARLDRDTAATKLRVAVIGAGVAGLTCARTLQDHGLAVSVFDKSRGVGGRLATRRTDAGPFDHGAQYFTARDRRFLRHVEAWRDRGLLAAWDPPGRGDAGGTDTWWVAVPGMNALGHHLAADLDVTTEVTVTRLLPEDGVWRILDVDRDCGRFDAVVVATPAPQTVPLLDATPALAARVAVAGMAPCWALLLAFDEPVPLPDIVRPRDSVIGWLARNASKPARHGQTWIVHADPEWSRAHLEETQADVAAAMLRQVRALADGPLPAPSHLQAHRWRYALADRPLGVPCLYESARRLAVCGDWCLGGRIEAAFLSGTAAAGRILNAAVTRARAER